MGKIGLCVKDSCDEEATSKVQGKSGSGQQHSWPVCDKHANDLKLGALAQGYKNVKVTKT